MSAIHLANVKTILFSFIGLNSHAFMNIQIENGTILYAPLRDN